MVTAKFPKLLIGIIFVISLTYIAKIMTNNSQSKDKGKQIWNILAYFPSVGNDASLVTWAHAVNSKKKLKEAIDAKSMMLECDVILNRHYPYVPILAHPPVTESDLSLNDLLNFINNVTDRPIGIKLDFKEMSAVQPSINLLNRRLSQLTGPLVLNADILTLECCQAKNNYLSIPLPAREFLASCESLNDQALLSVGWVTGGCNCSYCWSDASKMFETLQKICTFSLSGPVNFPVRACMLMHSLKQLTWLSNVTGGGVTIWTGASDPTVSIETVNTIREMIGANKVFVDLPK